MGLKISAVLTLALVVSTVGFKLYYDKTQAQMDKLRADIVTLKENEKILTTEIEKQNADLIAQKQETKEAFQRINDLNLANQQATDSLNQLREKFARHDLNFLSLRKPGLIQKIVNKGTADVLLELESITDN